ncbi:NADPH:quinone reductase [Fimbriiglobus ruber]|uniref:Quinone oxidoreductase n=1 Tax=Fimbriiglobus ruber TaxID=1908690 RepID=A0A225E4M3_9BACT|nr:NADPH:quinone reductase [Fimbriiglobus ruber]OWK46714.1 Quinone oxidoreductase [Fimbriiglobus ruber]
MKAAFYEKTGAPDVIQYGDLPTPEPAPGEVRVRVTAAALNPIDVYIRAGVAKMNLPFPFVPGCDLAGTVDAVGIGVTRYKPGDKVWGSNQGLLGRQGTFAEFCCAAEEFLYPLPDGVSEQDAAAAALTGITAHLGLFGRADLKAGETVFVNGGTGGVGSMVVQMAKAVDAKVITTVGSPEKAKTATDLGAVRVINYKSEDVTAAIQDATGGRGVDVWYETTPPADFDKTVELMAPRGRIIVMAGRAARPVFPNGPFYLKGLSMFGFAMFNCSADEQRQCADEMNWWLADKKLRPVIGKVMPLSEAAAAHRLQEENTTGKAGTLTGKIVVVPK